MKRDLKEPIHIDEIVLAIDPNKNDNVARFAIENRDKTKIKFLNSGKVYNKEEIKLINAYFPTRTRGPFPSHYLSILLRYNFSNGSFNFNTINFEYEEIYCLKEIHTIRDLENNSSICLGKLLDIEWSFVFEQAKTISRNEKAEKENKRKEESGNKKDFLDGFLSEDRRKILEEHYDF